MTDLPMTDTTYADKLPLLMAEVRKRLATLPGCHDWDHTLRVLHNARHIGRVEGAERSVVEFGALLHDIGRAAELGDAGKTCHAELGRQLVGEILPAVGVTNTAFSEHVAACVATHRYRRRNSSRPATIEAKVVYDADKLDSIGAVGIGRAFHFAGRIGARLHNSAAEALAATSYSREDSAYREFLVKLRDIPSRMLTAEGRRLAAERYRFMVAFFEQLEGEIRDPA